MLSFSLIRIPPLGQAAIQSPQPLHRSVLILIKPFFKGPLPYYLSEIIIIMSFLMSCQWNSQAMFPSPPGLPEILATRMETDFGKNGKCIGFDVAYDARDGVVFFSCQPENLWSRKTSKYLLWTTIQ